jgi:lipopolysaccharide/colanic/teichoic acid biosynthesis glycosyltransferase
MVRAQLMKRWCDVIAASVGLVLLAPVLAVITIAIYLKMGHPILFTQLRPGKEGKVFTFVKFRTMKNSRDSEGNFFPDQQRLTNLGRFLRETSLDELPQLWNVLEGNMSLVGPRPLLLDYMPYYSATEMQRHRVLPGITGLAQINGRNLLPWDERLALDVYYVDHWSLQLDLKILLKTMIKILQRDSVVVIPDTVLQNFHEERQSAES